MADQLDTERANQQILGLRGQLADIRDALLLPGDATHAMVMQRIAVIMAERIDVRGAFRKLNAALRDF